jgi:serine/threonine protein kinase
MYIVDIGELAVQIEGRAVRRLKRGDFFGELALLYDQPRSATVTAQTDCVLWSLERGIFKQIQQIASRESMMQRCRRFRNVPEFSHLSPDHMLKLMRCLTPMTYSARNLLYAEGVVATKVMLVESGRITFTVPPQLLDLPPEERDEAMGIVRPEGDDVPLAVSHGEEICDVYPGCIIGLAVLRGRVGLENGWTWVDRHVELVHVEGAECPLSAMAMESVTCVFFTVAKFERVLGPAADVFLHHPEVAISVKRKKSRVLPNVGFRNLYDLGEINFGRFAVGDLEEEEEGEAGVRVLSTRRYLLKCVSKAQVSEAGQAAHAMSEVRVLSALSNPFVVKLHGAYQTPDEVVLVLVPVTGGDLWSLIYQSVEEGASGRVLDSVDAIRFYSANVVIALEYMHAHDIAHRNLKPENVLLDSRGYCVLCGLGLAKRIPYVAPGEELKYFRSFSLCGTAEYLAPEMVLGSGHDQGVDLWALGVLLYEMVMRRTPFAGVGDDDLDISGVMAAIASAGSNSQTGESIVARELFDHIDYGFDLFVAIRDLLHPDPHEYDNNMSRHFAASSCISSFCRRITINGENSLSMTPFYEGFDWFELKEQSLEPPYLPISDTLSDKLYLNQGYSHPSPEYTGDQELFKDFGLL